MCWRKESQKVAEKSERAFELITQGMGPAPIMLVCEHASNHMPDKFNNLGLPDHLLESHIAWDPGSDPVTRRMSEVLEMPAFLGTASRLLYDLNRPPDVPDAMRERSEIFDIPGNLNLSEAQKQERIDTYYKPYHYGLEEVLEAQIGLQAIVTIHSFTPIFHGKTREVELGILHEADPRLADAMLKFAPRHTDMVVRRNDPYGPGDGVMHTLREHGVKHGRLNVMLEIRNDLIKTQDQCIAMADMLCGLVVDALELVGQAQIAQGQGA